MALLLFEAGFRLSAQLLGPITIHCSDCQVYQYFMSTPTVSGVSEECTLPQPHIPHLGLPCNITCSLCTLHVYFILSTFFQYPSDPPNKWTVFLPIALMPSLSLKSLVLNWAHIMSFNKPIINANIEMSKTVKIHVTNS